MKGEGTLTGLEELKAEYRDAFRAGAKGHQIDQECADLLCVFLIRSIGVGRDGLWRVKGKTCQISDKRCPKGK